VRADLRSLYQQETFRARCRRQPRTRQAGKSDQDQLRQPRQSLSRMGPFADGWSIGTMKTVVINYGMGNLGSVRRALEECGADVAVSENPSALANADRIVLPGVGAFGDGMQNLHAAQWPAAIKRALEN